ncbi:PEPxxWA-CTERM sorting domain-containing protein [Phenylobacterium sp.]|uniref:PEPxxWA-CTERM sorting domain-containing protein n=1 Tax=Phenylobacterium sp. TaxID=1871053 RepID=UPI00374D63BD
MSRRVVITAVAFATAALTAAPALAAGVTAYTDINAFHALGVIGQTTDFQAYPTGVATDFGGYYFDRDLTFYGGDLAVFGKTYLGFNAQRNSLADNFQDSVNANVDKAGYNLISFDVGNLRGFNKFTLTLVYFDGAALSFEQIDESSIPASQGFQFYGFGLPNGAYFTGFTISANNSVQEIISNTSTVPGLSQVELGFRAGPGVPEPAGWILLITGFGAVGAALRSRRSSPARSI